MNRKVKFRAWDGEQTHMLKPELLGLGWKVEDLNNEKFIVMQFTGLHDKNRKEIYEGDVVEFSMIDKDKGTIRLPVVWDENGAGFHCADAKTQRGVDMAAGYDTISGEVIGNIYENPELLDNPTTP